jgi:hypothetical protein
MTIQYDDEPQGDELNDTTPLEQAVLLVSKRGRFDAVDVAAARVSARRVLCQCREMYDFESAARGHLAAAKSLRLEGKVATPETISRRMCATAMRMTEDEMDAHFEAQRARTAPLLERVRNGEHVSDAEWQAAI